MELIKTSLLYLNTSLLNKMETHQRSSDHDNRYYTETEMDTKISDISNNISVKVISGIDINTFISFDDLMPKLYFCEACINFPWSNGWLLCLPNSIGSNKSSKQIALRHGTYNVNNFNTQVRNYYNSSHVWSNWYSYMTNVDFTDIDKTDHLIKFGKMGIYYGAIPIEQVPNGVAAKELDMSSIFSGISSVTATLVSGIPDKKNVSVLADGTVLKFYMSNSLTTGGITHSWYTIVGTLK